MIHKSLIISLCLVLSTSMLASAHGGNEHQQSNDSSQVAKAPTQYQETHNTGTLADFPKLHPMVVHFPIIFLLLAFLAQVGSLFIFKKELSWTALLLVAGGFIGAYVASHIFHGGDPDLKMLDPITRSHFERHELYASYTVWVSALAALVKILSQFVFKRHLIAEILVTLLLAGAAYTITITGDMGARLVHIDGVGVQGNELPAHDDD